MVGDAATLKGGKGTAFDFLELMDLVPLFLTESIGYVDESARVAQGDDFGPLFDELRGGVKGDIAGPAHGDTFVGEDLVVMMEHVFAEVDAAPAGRFGADDAAAVSEAFTGEDTTPAVL